MINLKDKLSHLTYRQACKLLGAKGEKLIRQGGKYEIDISEQVILRRNIFQLNLGEAVITIRLDPEKNQKLNFQCSAWVVPTKQCRFENTAMFCFVNT